MYFPDVCLNFILYYIIKHCNIYGKKSTMERHSARLYAAS